MSKTEEAIEMFVGRLVLDTKTKAPVVLLQDESGESCIPIWIGIAEATSIASAIKQVTMPRPLTHDLLHSILAEVSVEVERIVITELRDSTYFAELVLRQGDRAIVVDSRPSDAIAIALRSSAPIFVTQSVLDQAKIAFNPSMMGEDLAPSGDAPAEGAEGEGDTESNERSEADFTGIDREKWEEILADLDPDDFKYKM